MPQAIEADRELIKQLWIQGLSTEAIASKTGVNRGTIRTWINRYGWNTLKSNLTEAVRLEVKGPLLTDQVAQASIAARNKLAEHLQSTVALLPKPKTWKQGARQQQDLESTVRNAEKVFGWKESTASSMINSRSISAFESIPDSKATEAQPVLDVATIEPAQVK